MSIVKSSLIKSLVLSTTLMASTAALAAPLVQFETTLGSFTIDLNAQQAPISVTNFLKYVDDGSYVGSVFHRVIPGFMAQGGGFNEKLEKLPTYAPIKNEANNGLKNKTATVAMARTSDPDSASRQFFINYANNEFLDKSAQSDGYAVFGTVIDGFDVVQKMAMEPTTTVGHMADVPIKTITITKVTLID